jgi:general secretion pathway protein B
MSFILDALKKSETDRQRHGSAEFAGVPASSGPAGPPRWLWVLGLLLAINLIVLLGLMLQPDAEPPVLPTPAAPETNTPVVALPTFADQVAEARQNIPARQEAAPVVPQSPTSSSVAPDTAPASASRQSSTNTAALPTFLEVVANGRIMLPDLHLDIHVYSETPGDRFVFINMSKQREKSQLSEGPVVEEITPDGVVLAYQGTTFLLSRD